MFLLGAVGGGGILLNSNEILELSYSLGIGEDTNNIEEALALWKGLYQAKAMNITEINVFGDSWIVIQDLITNRHPNNMRLEKIHKKIKFLMKSFHNIKIFHNLCELNREVDKVANETIPLDKGTLNLNGNNQPFTLP